MRILLLLPQFLFFFFLDLLCVANLVVKKQELAFDATSASHLMLGIVLHRAVYFLEPFFLLLQLRLS